MPPKQPIKIPARALRQVKKMKDERPVTDRERVFRAGLAFALGVPDGWLFDDVTGEFLPSKKRAKSPDCAAKSTETGAME
jgi:hypothetical protein